MEIDFSNVLEFGRQDGLKKAISLLHEARQSDVVIVETGTTRGNLGGTLLGDGWATRVFGWYCRKYGGLVWTIDCMAKAIMNSRILTAKYAFHIRYIVSDSVEYLETFDTPIDLLYLDSSDDPKNTLAELNACYNNLKPKTIIIVDDTNREGGKGELVIPLLEERGWDIEFIDNGPQIIATRIAE